MKEIREQIHEIDQQLVELFRKRMDAASKIAAYKNDHGLQSFDPVQERALLKRVTDQAGPDLALDTKILYRTLLALSRARQDMVLQGNDSQMQALQEAIQHADPLRLFPEQAIVACQGAEGAFSLRAAERFFKNPDPMFFNSFENVFQAVEKGLCRYGVLPVENSTAGTVNQVYDLMRKYRFNIVRSAKLHVMHSLLAAPGAKLEDIHEVYSHEQALMQCSDFLHAHPEMKCIPVENTAVAAKMVSESGRKDVAAISSRECAQLYGLVPLELSLQNNANNVTRFICISKELEIFPGAERTSVMLTLPHRQGALYNIMSLLSVHDVNLQKLESRPVPGSDFAFMFYFDMDISPLTPNFMSLMKSLRSASESFFYLGSYSELA